jgi:hypothetical protein
MHRDNIIKAYFKGLERNDYEEVISLFSATASISSPLYGSVSATLFCQAALQEMDFVKIEILDTFVSCENKHSAAAHVFYQWRMKDGTLMEFEGANIFELVPDRQKIERIIILYDTAYTRSQFNRFSKQRSIT